MSTTRERKERKAERLGDWAESRDAKSDAAHDASHAATAGIPFGQPVLVGHHSQRRHERAIERGRNAATAALEHSRTAEAHRDKARNIDLQLANSIYSDDADAVERLTEKIAGLEAERERIKSYNASCRKAAKIGGVGDLSLLDATQQRDIQTIARVCSYQLGKGGAFPAYALGNLGGNISRLRQRLESLSRERDARESGQRIGGRRMAAKYGGECAECGAAVARGDSMTYYRATREVVCADCEA